MSLIVGCCKARIYGSGSNTGLGPQCSRKAKFSIDDGDKCYCKKHYEQYMNHGNTDWGSIDEPRPNNNLITGNHCHWRDQPKKMSPKKMSPNNSPSRISEILQSVESKFLQVETQDIQVETQDIQTDYISLREEYDDYLFEVRELLKELRCTCSPSEEPMIDNVLNFKHIELNTSKGFIPN